LAKTKYKRIYCEKVVEYFMRFIELRDDPEISEAAERSGMIPITVEGGSAKADIAPCSGYPSLVKFAIKIGVTPRTISYWRQKYPDFDEACEFADAIQDEVLNERALVGDVDGRVAMKIRELKANAKLAESGHMSGPALVINLNDDPDEKKIEIQKWTEPINEDTDY
jgi:hypothetical protein